MKTTIIYRRKLPHIQPLNGDFFVTFRLKIQLPEDIADKLNKIYQGNKNNPSNLGWGAYSEYFREYDSFLDFIKSGPKYLSDKKIANMIIESLHFRNGREYELVCYTIMSNHVHMVVLNTSKYLFKIMHSLKRYTAFEANRLLNREGSFWQREYTDRIIRNDWKDWSYSYLDDKYKVGPIDNRT
ncbi:MAG: hypothetical protein AMS27_10020 [Bacteroides sp. SM23_62_1]|nr:MAG: hypothetical protein AMS27_10020 [Bacteroides sp. SM23_62_1]